MDNEKREDIKKEAKAILDKFSAALGRVKVKGKKTGKGAGGYRNEEDGKAGDSDFRERMFENAPSKDRDCIVAEKKTW